MKTTPSLQQLSRLMAQPWAIRRDSLRMFSRLALTGEDEAVARKSKSEAKNRFAPVAGYAPMNGEGCCAMDELPDIPALPEGCKVILPWGMLGRAWSECERWCYDPVDVDEMIGEIEETPEGSTVVLWFRSPGGITTGIPETAAALRQLGKTRRLLAFTDDSCCSAAYWLAAQCESIHATPTADVGSIGVYIALYDYTEYMSRMGVSLELFKAGSMKAMGLEGNPLSDEESAWIQRGVDESYKAFTADVLRNRALDEATMQGQAFRGRDALAANLVDSNWGSASAFFTALGRGKI